MSSAPATIETATPAHPGEFLDFRATHDKRKHEVTLKCGNCNEPTCALVPTEEYHVVTVGRLVGIFTNGAIADTLVNGVEMFARKKVHSWTDAVEYFAHALAAKSVEIKNPSK